MSARVLHVLSQRPLLTGSGVTIDALARHAARAGYEQAAVVGVPADEDRPAFGGLASEQIHPLGFGTAALPFPVPGMSDVMPYQSTRFSNMDAAELTAYRDAWRLHLTEVRDRFRPDLVHAHHIWIVGALLRDVFGQTPIVSHCHATGLRQMELCPHLADEVRSGCARNDRFCVLHAEHAALLADRLGVGRERIEIVAAGVREDLFQVTSGSPERSADAVIYAGKYSRAKGLPWLLDAIDRVAERRPGVVLHVAGSGTGAEADALRARMESMAPRVVLHGQVTQDRLAELMRSASLFVLPSFYEGLPLVLVEAFACGCRLVSTRLSGVEQAIAPHLTALEMVPPPRLRSVDEPEPEDLPAFVDGLARAIEDGLERGAANAIEPSRLAPFTWGAVFDRIERVWTSLW